MGKDIGAGGADIFIYGAQAIVEWNSSNGQFSVPYYIPYLSLEIDNLKRSADHNWAVFAADKLYIYSSAKTALFPQSIPSILLHLAFEISRQTRPEASLLLSRRTPLLFMMEYSMLQDGCCSKRSRDLLGLS